MNPCSLTPCAKLAQPLVSFHQSQTVASVLTNLSALAKVAWRDCLPVEEVTSLFMLSVHQCNCAGLRRWHACQRRHAQLICQPTRRTLPHLHSNPLLRLYQSARVRPILALSVLTGRSYALQLESGKLYKTEIMNKSVRPLFWQSCNMRCKRILSTATWDVT